jgi:hypothetical protein
MHLSFFLSEAKDLLSLPSPALPLNVKPVRTSAMLAEKCDSA